jgi:hypothetical protein
LKVITKSSIHFLAKVKWFGSYLYVSEQAPSACASSTTELSIVMLLLGYQGILLNAEYAKQKTTKVTEFDWL